MNIKTTIKIFIILTLITSCKKDNDNPKSYELDSYEIGKIKLYTNNGEITDTSVINNFIKRVKSNFWIDNPLISNSEIQFKFISDTKAQLIVVNDTAIDLNITSRDGILYLEYTNSITFIPIVINKRLKFSPLHVYYSPANSEIPSTYFPCIYAIENNGKLRIPHVSYFEQYRYEKNGMTYGEMVGNFNNLFNEKYLDTLSTLTYPDTIAFQDNYLIYK
jgi:hypothetical protein